MTHFEFSFLKDISCFFLVLHTHPLSILQPPCATASLKNLHFPLFALKLYSETFTSTFCRFSRCSSLLAPTTVYHSSNTEFQECPVVSGPWTIAKWWEQMLFQTLICYIEIRSFCVNHKLCLVTIFNLHLQPGLEKCLAPTNEANISSILGKGY